MGSHCKPYQHVGQDLSEIGQLSASISRDCIN